MSVQITIRDVPDEVRDELAARAARSGRSMQEYLKGELERLARRPTVNDWLERVRRRKDLSRNTLGGDVILEHRTADRR